MREIRFRYAWKRLSDGHIWMEISPIEAIEGRGDKPFILNKDCFTAWKLLGRDLFTGLKDKNGCEIYEGDILGLIEPEQVGKQTEFGRMVVKFGEYNTYEIESGDESIGWYTEGYYGYLRENGERDIYKTNSFDEHSWSLLRCITEWEVIGNIYENPELFNKEAICQNKK